MAAQNIGNLKVSIGADTNDLARGIGRAKALMGGLARSAKVVGIAAGASFAAASAGMIAMTKGGLQAVDAQAKMARSIDGSIDGLRALQIAGADAGASVGDMNGAVQMMGKRLSEAAREGTGPAADALKMLGLDARTLMEMDVDARFGAIADRINEMGLSAQDAAGVMREFGVRSNEVSLALLQGSGAIRAAREEVQKFGLSMSDEMAAKVEMANDALSRVGFVFEGMRNQLAVGLAPALQVLAVQFQEASVAGGPLQSSITMLVSAFSDLAAAVLDPAFIEAATLFGTTLVGAIAGAARIMVTLSDNAAIAGTAMIALGAAMAFFSGPIGLAIAAVAGGVFLLSTRLGDSKTAAELADQAYDDLQAALDAVDRSNAASIASGEQLIATHIDQGRAALEAAKGELALARAKQQAGNALLDENPLTAGGNSGYAEAMAENTAAAEAQLDAAEAQLTRYQRALEGFKRSQYPSQGARAPASTPGTAPGTAPGTTPGGTPGGTAPGSVAKLTDELGSLVKVIDPAQAHLEQMAAAQDVLKRALDAGVITQEEYNQRLAQVNEKFKEIPSTSGAAAAGVRAICKEVKKTKEETQLFDKGWETAFSNLVNNIENSTASLKNFAAEVLKMLAMKGIKNLIGGLPFTTGMAIGFNALGTDNWRGGLSWVGERGPELVNLPMGAQVIPNNKLGGPSRDGGGASELHVVGGDLTLSDNGTIMAQVQVMTQRSVSQSVSAAQKTFRNSKSGWAP